MKYSLRPTTKFEKDLKRVKKRGYDISLLTAIIKMLADGETLPEKNRDHRSPEHTSVAESAISRRTGC